MNDGDGFRSPHSLTGVSPGPDILVDTDNYPELARAGMCRVSILCSLTILGLVLSTSSAGGYIHNPPISLPMMCKLSDQIRLLKIEKVTREKGTIVFAVAESLKGEKSQFQSFKHAIRIDAVGTEAILDWAREGKTAVMFWLEGTVRNSEIMASGYVFIDGHCYSVDYYNEGKCWLMLRMEPTMSICYHGSVEQLRESVKDILCGKEVNIPVKEPDVKEDSRERRKEIVELLKKSRPDVFGSKPPVFVLTIMAITAALPLFVYLIRVKRGNQLARNTFGQQQFVRLLLIIAGISFGIIVNILYFSDEVGQTNGGIGVLLASAGAAIGGAVGSIVGWLRQW